MTASLHPAIFAIGVVLAGSLDYDPHVLTLRYGDGRSERIAASSGKTCNVAVEAIHGGLWSVRPKPREAICTPGDLFAPGSDCIHGFNCGGAP